MARVVDVLDGVGGDDSAGHLVSATGYYRVDLGVLHLVELTHIRLQAYR